MTVGDRAVSVDLVPVVNFNTLDSTFQVADVEEDKFIDDHADAEELLANLSREFPRLHDVIRLAKCWNVHTLSSNGPKGVFVEVCCYRLQHLDGQTAVSHLVELFEFLIAGVESGRVKYKSVTISSGLDPQGKVLALAKLKVVFEQLKILPRQSLQEQADTLRSLFRF
jgi:hypothetical protein